LTAAIAHDRRGSGEPVLLIHGVGSRRRTWAPVVERIASAREAIAVDLPGFGESPPDEVAPTVEAYADRLTAFAAELGLERPHVAGNSMGGAIALELGRRGEARTVTAFSPIGFWSGPERLWSRALLQGGRRVGDVVVPRLPEPLLVAVSRPSTFLYSFGKPFTAPAAEVLGTVRDGVAAPAFDEAVSNISRYVFGDPAGLTGLPVTIAWGRRDVLVPYLSWSRRARRLLPEARHVTLAGAGHVPFFDDPAACAAVLIEATGG
jgi:pimeloyl-ACP methyl ester carboxylesterase